MSTLRIATATLAATLVAAALAAPAFAAAAEEQEQTVLMNSRITLSQAIVTAEQQTGGKAFDAGVDVDHGKPRVVIETNGPKGVQTVMVDLETGHVVGMQAGGVAD